MKREVDGARRRIGKLEQRLERTRAAQQRLKDMPTNAGGAKTAADIVAQVDIQDRLDDAELGLERERRSLARAEWTRDVLQKVTYPKTLKELEGEVKKTHSNELAKQAT